MCMKSIYACKFVYVHTYVVSYSSLYVNYCGILLSRALSQRKRAGSLSPPALAP